MNTSAPLKVLLLTSSYPRNDSDNSSVFLRYLATNLAKQGVDIHVLAPDHPRVKNAALDAGVKNHWFQYLPKQWQQLTYGSGILPNLKRNKLLYLHVPFFLISMFFSLLFLCKKIKPDVIHAHWIIPQGFIAVIVGKLLNIPVIATAHGGDAFSLNTDLLSRLKVFTLKRCKFWTANTSATAKAFGTTSDLPKPIIIPMGVDIEHFRSGNADNVLGTETRKIILFVGRLVEKKGVKYLIKAFSMLPKKTQDESTLWIVGDGDERKSLEHQAQNLGVKNIKFWGQIQNKQLPDFYAAATLFVAPSIIDSKGDTEGQGVILLEAMASKTPIIATTVGGISEVITDGKTGLLVQQKNSSALSTAIQLLVNNPKTTEAYSGSALEHLVKTYSWEPIAQQFISIFNDLSTKS
ncbi:MAG: glycosyltransferase [Cycloclasticus sp.]|nr:glycosyltransferase [Cycloclasticus sp.]MBQ0788976.1 glycosyltransferase [Cycloclasticus sp.]